MDDVRTRGWLEEIDELSHLYADRFGDLGPEQLNWKPSGDVWSVGQVLDHVIRTNESYYAVVEEAREPGYRPPVHGRIRLLARFLGGAVLKGVRPEAQRKVKTFDVWEPTNSDVPADIVERFVRHHDELGEVVRGAADLVDRGVVIPSPASRLVVYELGTAFDILLAHERRHLAQAECVLERLRSAG